MTKYLGPSAERWEDDAGQVITGVHTSSNCSGHCPLHGPSDHHMNKWPLVWRWEHHYFERTCPHGIGHPDPDSITHLKSMEFSEEGIHGCDGCCGVTP